MLLNDISEQQPQLATIRDCRLERSGIVIDIVFSTAVDLRVTIERNEFLDVPSNVVNLQPAYDSDTQRDGVIWLTLQNNVAVRSGPLLFSAPGPFLRGFVNMIPTVVNNTVIDATGDIIELIRGSSGWHGGVVISNNLFIGGAGYGISGEAGWAEVSNNMFSGIALSVFKSQDEYATPAELNTWDLASGNLDATPTFVDAASDDYRLAVGSRGIDEGLDASAAPDDLEKDLRPLDGDGDMLAVADIGVDEYRDGPALLRNMDATSVAPLSPNRMTLFPLRSPRDDYLTLLPLEGLDEPGILGDLGLPLVLYQLARPGNVLHLVKKGELRLEYGR